MNKTVLISLTIFLIGGCEQPTEFIRENPNDYHSNSFSPKEPLDLTLDILSDSQIKLEWDHENSDSVRFEIQRSQDQMPFETVSIVQAPGSAFIDSLLLDLGSSYQYRISSIKGNIKSDFFHSPSITFQLKPPAFVSVDGSSETSAEIKWKSTNDYFTRYKIEIKNEALASFTVLTDDHNGKEFIFHNLSPENEYTIRLASVSDRFQSDYAEQEILYTQRPKFIQSLNGSNSFYRDAAYLSPRSIVTGKGSNDWHIENSPTQEHVVISTYGNIISLYNNALQLVSQFTIENFVGSPPTIPPYVQVSSKWNRIITHHNSVIQLYDFQGEVVKEFDTDGFITEIHISEDEQYIFIHYVKEATVPGKRDRYFKVWSLPDLAEVAEVAEVAEFYIIREDSPGIPFISNFAVSSDSKIIAATGKNKIHFYSFEPSSGIKFKETINDPLNQNVSSLAFSHDDKFLFIGYSSGSDNFLMLDMNDFSQYDSYLLYSDQLIWNLSIANSPYFMAIQVNSVSEWTYQHDWFFK